MRLKVQHQTRYQYDEPVAYSIQRLRMTPDDFDGQKVLHWHIDAPGIEQAISYQDGFDNQVQLVTVTEPHQEMLISVSGEIETTDTHGQVNGLKSRLPVSVYLRHTPATRPDAQIRRMASEHADGDWVACCHNMMNVIHERVEYLIGATGVATTAAQAMADRQGVCQDHAHIFIAAMRSLGLPSRYVSGYMMVGNDAQTDDKDAPMTADANHAWAETLIPDLGWVGFDVANRCSPTDRYVRLATGLDYGYAAPVRGSRRGGGDESLDVQVVVQQQQQQQ